MSVRQLLSTIYRLLMWTSVALLGAGLSITGFLFVVSTYVEPVPMIIEMPCQNPSTPYTTPKSRPAPLADLQLLHSGL